MKLGDTKLHGGLAYLRRKRIADDRNDLDPGGTSEPFAPELATQQWERVKMLFDRDIDKLRARLDQLPSVFTRTQLYVVGAIFHLFDAQGTTATFTRQELHAIMRAYIKVDGQPLGDRQVSAHTITDVLYAMSDTGAVKYIPGWSGTRSRVELVDLHWLHDRGLRKQHTLDYRVGTSVPLPAVAGDVVATPLHTPSQVSSFGIVPRPEVRSFEALLRDLYRGTDRSHRGLITRTFNRQCRAQGLYTCQAYTGDTINTRNGILPAREWRVSYTDDTVWQVEIAVRETHRALAYLLPKDES